MALTKTKKREIVKNTSDRLKKAAIVVFTNFHGLDMPGTLELRRKLREDGTDYVVVKKRLLDHALRDAGYEYVEKLEGEVGVAIGYDDPTLVARGAYQFARTHKEQFKLLGGIFEKRPINASGVNALAMIPPREVLLGQFANVLAAPIRGFARTLNGVQRQLVCVLEQVKSAKI